MRPASSSRDAFPASPCIQICTLDEAKICMGCRRSLQEIVGWGRMSPEEQRDVLRQLPDRRR